jgi:hypothetical protein
MEYISAQIGYEIVSVLVRAAHIPDKPDPGI